MDKGKGKALRRIEQGTALQVDLEAALSSPGPLLLSSQDTAPPKGLDQPSQLRTLIGMRLPY